MAIKDWPEQERPREKLLIQGPKTLSDAELLAIFLRTGCAGQSAVDLARGLLVKFGGLRPLLEADRDQFCAAPGLGLAKFSQLQAILEMSRRHLSQALERGCVFTHPNSVRDYLKIQLRHLQQEVFVILFLDCQHQLLAYEEVFHGTIDGAHVYPREVVKKALSHNAAAIILAHNHPSGVAEPSQADVRLTKRLEDACALIDIRLLDHFVVGDNDVISLAERGLI